MDTAKNIAEQGLAEKIEELGREFLKGGYYLRLVMTDDILSLKDIHARATEGKDDFFYGQTIPDPLQEVVDGIVRGHKTELLDLISTGDEALAEIGLDAKFDDVQQAYLVKIAKCGMGFFISKKIHTERHMRKTRMTLGKLDKALNASGKTSGRRKIVLGSVPTF